MGDDNGKVKARVTVALLGQKIDTLTDVVSQAMEDAKDDRKVQGEIVTRVAILETNQTELKRVVRSDKMIERVAAAIIGLLALAGIKL